MDSKEWKLFYLKDLFNITKGTRLTISDRVEGDIPFVTAGHDNQGVSSFIGNDNLEVFQDVITIDMFSEAFYRGYSFCCDDNIHVLTPKQPLNKYSSLFIVSVINTSKDILSYGKQFRLKTFERQRILLPIDENSNPDFKYMEIFMRNKEKELLNKYNNHLENLNAQIGGGQLGNLNEIQWAPFSLEELGYIFSGKDIYEDERISGDIPYITAKSVNNGVGHYVKNINNTLQSNAISINRNGAVGYAFYHPYKALYSNDCRKFVINKNKYISLFIVNQIKLQKEKFSYGYKMGTERLNKTKIMLPVDDEGNPNYDYMEKYMINKEMEMLNRYLDFLNQ